MSPGFLVLIRLPRSGPSAYLYRISIACMWVHESHPRQKCDSRKRMESYSRRGFDSCIHIESNPRRVFDRYGHFHPILAGFSVDMAISVQFPAGFACIHTNFKSFSPGCGWSQRHTSQNLPGLGFIVQSGIKFLIRMGRGVLHTPQNLPGLRFIQ